MLSSLSGKERAARVPLNYFRRAGRRKWLVTLTVLSVALVAAAASVASGFWRQLAMPGKVHNAHAAFEDNCAACHAPLQPSTSRNPLQAGLQTGPVSDQLCQNCHSGPPHHPVRQSEESPHCSSCHVEHKGRHAPLAQNPDSACTQCHGSLDSHVKDGVAGYENRITRFSAHPQFRIGSGDARRPVGQANDPGKLLFNHKTHLTPGVRTSPTDRGGWTIGDIKDKALRERYREQQPPEQRRDADLAKLNCASCHQADATDAPPPGPGQAVGRRSPGDYMRPATYDQHCKACHPLTFDTELPGVQIPHHLQPAEVNRFLWGAVAGREVKALALVGDKRPLPGDNLSRLEREARKAIQSGVNGIESILHQRDRDKAIEFVSSGKTTCGLCHPVERQPGKAIPDRIPPTGVPEVWFPHAKFSHRAHRAVDCQQCHAAGESTSNLDVLLPGVENCQTCHAPKMTVGGQHRGGVRHDCVTCHRYHNGDDPLAGIGAKARGVSVPRSIQEFLDPR